MIALLVLSLLGAEPKLPGDSVYRVDATFKTDAGADFKLASLRGKPVILAFAYTTCGSTCPLTLRKLKLAQRRVDQDQREVQFVVVSLDPAKDTPKTLASFRTHQKIQRPNWHLLTGNPSGTRVLAMALGFKFAQSAADSQVMHDNTLFLLDAEGRVTATVTSLDEDVDALTASPVAAQSP